VIIILGDYFCSNILLQLPFSNLFSVPVDNQLWAAMF